MKTKKIIIIIFASLALLAILASVIFIKNRPTNFVQKQKEEVSNQAIGAQYTDASIFLSPIKQSKTKPVTEKITGLIVPHHLLAKDIIADTFASASAGNYKNIVLLSPDHFQAGKSEVSVTERDFSTVFGTIESEKEIANQLKNLSFVGEGDFFYREHGLQAQLPFIKYYFPKAKIIAITFKPTVSKEKLDQVISVLEKNLGQDSLIIQSTDFSHYLTPTKAAEKDAETMAIINNSETEKTLELNQPDNIDSSASLYVQTVLQKDFFKNEAEILAHKNSQDYTNKKVDSSTSYLSAIYHEKINKLSSGNAEFIFVGDIMLSRYIGEMMAKRQDYDFPFQKINKDLAGADFLFGNLETPVSINGKSTGSLYPFRSDPKVLSGLKNAGFKMVSVANNHAFDYSLEAFKDTLSNLKAVGLTYTGGGDNFQETHSGAYQEINGIKVIVLAYTNLLPQNRAATDNQAGITYLDENQMVKDIKAAKEKADLVIATFHWGQEYQTKSNAHQQKIAAKAVEAGADLIVGHHPHVAQEVAEINGVPVAYSLGNFVFDQNFSPETNTGLILKVKIENKKIIKIEPETIRFTKNFQPYLAK